MIMSRRLDAEDLMDIDRIQRGVNPSFKLTGCGGADLLLDGLRNRPETLVENLEQCLGGLFLAAFDQNGDTYCRRPLDFLPRIWL